MAFFQEGIVDEIVDDAGAAVDVAVKLDDGRTIRAAVFPEMTGTVSAGHRVVVNTTGLDLALGTGGVGFVLWDYDGSGPTPKQQGHIVKLRYTPWQMDVLAAEEPAAPTHDALVDAVSLNGMPVVVCGLHSQIAGVTAGIKAVDPALRVAYVMTDAGALPMAWSRLVRDLRAAGLLDATVTTGHAFGGDLETVNIFSALVAVRHALEADVGIVALGPGVVGTATRLGFSAIEQGQVLDAVTALGGRAVAALRIGFTDDRPRHHGVSHHSVTALQIAARERCTVVVPNLGPDRREEVISQLVRAGITERHEVVQGDGAAALDLLRDRGLEPTTMGRSLDDVPELFAAGGAAGRVAADLALRRRSPS